MNDHGHIIAEGRCSRCQRTAAQLARSRRRCPGVPWYIQGRAPDHLYTRRQLHSRGLRPTGAAVGCIVTAFGDLVWLYDVAETSHRRGETERQRAARLATWAKTQEKWKCAYCGNIPDNIGELAQYWCRAGLCEECRERLAWQKKEAVRLARWERDRQKVSSWAAQLFAEPETWAIIDTETTSLKGIIVEIALVGADGTVLFRSLVNPDGVPVSQSARWKHGLTDEELAAAPRLPEIWPQILEALAGRGKLIAYHAAFDSARIEQSTRRYNLPLLEQEWECAMEAYAAYCGDWSDEFHSYRWKPLDGDHRAVGDCLATLALLREMNS